MDFMRKHQNTQTFPKRELPKNRNAGSKSGFLRTLSRVQPVNCDVTPRNGGDDGAIRQDIAPN
jgi:hypothetical protein